MTETLPFFLVLSIPFVEWVMAWRSERPARRPLAYRIGLIGGVIVLACSVLVNAQGGLLSASTCWNLKGHNVESVDQDPARAWSWSNPQLVYGFRAIGSEGLAAVTACPDGTPLP
jgi:hypothetical protein